MENELGLWVEEFAFEHCGETQWDAVSDTIIKCAVCDRKWKVKVQIISEEIK